MEESKIISSISNYYDNLVTKFGYDPKSCDYGHSNSQAIKFKVLSEAIDYSDKKILDIGCGFADYYNFLASKFQNINYHGVDISKKMIDTGKKLHPDLNLSLINVFETPLSETFNVVTANGIFYLLGKESKKMMQTFIYKMFEMCDNVVVFNSLSTWATDQEANEFYADPLETVAYCKSLTEWVTLRHDYHPRDFTIYMYKNRNI